MQGYFEAPEETARALRDGWYHTGDLAAEDDEGYLFVCGRLKDVIRSGGESIFPQELERTIVELDGVAECAVVGVDDPDWGEAALAAVVLARGGGGRRGDGRRALRRAPCELQAAAPRHVRRGVAQGGSDREGAKGARAPAVRGARTHRG